MRSILILLLFSLFMSCSTDNAVPPGIIPAAKMETILWQLIQSDEFIITAAIKDSTKKSSPERIKIYQQVLDLNKISKEEFKKSYQYYLGHPDITKLMFDSIAARATRQKGDAYKLKTVQDVK